MSSPLEEHRAWLAASHRRWRRRSDPRLERLPDRPCGAASRFNETECDLEVGHPGPHDWAHTSATRLAALRGPLHEVHQ